MTKYILRIAALSSLAMSALAAATLMNAGIASAYNQGQKSIALPLENVQSCQINQSINNGMLKLESVYGNEEAGAGEYKLTIRSMGGGNNVNTSSQGQFFKQAGEIVTLGKSFLSAHGQTYEVKLDVSFNGKTHNCVEKIKTSI